MKVLRVTTTYKNCTEEFVEWYLKRLYNEEVLPGSTGIIDEIRKNGRAKFESKDPDGPTIATTMYELIEEQPRPASNKEES